MNWSDLALSCTRLVSCPITKSIFIPFVVDGKQCGMILKENIGPFKEASDKFTVNEKEVKFKDSIVSVGARTFAINEFFSKLRYNNTFSYTLKGWRDETYTVFDGFFNSKKLFDIERAAVPILSCKSYGVHMNGYIYKDGQMMMWLGKRAANKSKYPGCYDNIVAGGISSGYNIWDTLVKEAKEEADIPSDLMSKCAKPAGAISYTIVNQYGISPEVEFVYDLELPSNFVPKNIDGEVQGFELMTIDQVKEVVVTDKFKHNCAGVVIDFLIRHGLVDPDSMPTYVEIMNLLHAGHPF